MSDSQPTWTGRTIGGRYVIESLLGRGGMSSVYKATDPNLQRTVAIKIIHPHLSEHPEFIKRFEQEAAAVARLRHPNIMLVHDFNHDGSVYYIVFEYIAGNPLDKRLKDLKEAGLRLPLSEAIQIMVPLCEAVAYAHERKMIHRDLKPSNVIINLLGQPILLDFGIAKIVGGGHVHTATGATIGTAAYMAPEQVVGDEVDHRADIYSLGIMLYEMACGRPPYEGQSALTVMMKHVNEPLPDIRLFNSNLPDVFSAILEKALAKDPKGRFGSAIEMAMALREVGRQIGNAAGTDTMAYTTPTPPVEKPLSQTEALPTTPKPEPVTEPETVPQTAVAPSEPITEPIAMPEVESKKSARNWLPLALGGLALLAIIAAAIILLPRVFAPDLPPSAGMVQIPGGTYTVGADLSGSQYSPPQEVTLEPYWIDRFEVSNSNYAAFLTDTETEPPSSWPNGNPPVGQDDHPVRGITWENAYDYCDWQGKRLPSEAEWEVAARGRQGLLYPWGNDQTSVNLPQDSTYASGSLPANHSSFGVFDMAGNVWEWVDEPYTDVPEEQAVARGGAFDFLKDMAYRLQGNPNLPTMIASTGVRCAATEVEVVPDETILLSDEFIDPQSGWPDLKEDNAWRGYHPPDYYHVEATGENQVATAVFGTEAGNISLEARIFVDILVSEDGGYRYGLLVRQAGDKQFYAFTIAPRAGEWAALKATPDGLETLDSGPIEGLTGGSTTPIQGGSADTADTLRVDASGSTFAFFVNGRIVTTITDSSYGSGDFGFFVETFEETRAHVHYDTVTVLELGETLAQDTGETVAVEPTEAAEVAEVVTEEATEPTATTAVEPTETAAAEGEPTATTEPTPTPEPTTVPAPERMILIPGGGFLMGSETGEPNERPEHPVTLDAYFIDQFEVTNEEYLACVADGGCTQTGLRNSFRRAGYRDDPLFANYPVMGVTWGQANAYCEWAGKRLPTEAEWEFAASGPDNFTWPWGNEFDATLSAASSLDTEPVDDFPNGVSPFGVFNMAGNVNEWVLDRFDANFYANSPEENPVNPDSGTSQIYRGGSFDNTNGAFFTTSRRFVVSGNTFDVDIGFRCALDMP